MPRPPINLVAIRFRPTTIKIVPKGLRSFDEHDADFFLELLPGPRDREGLPDSLRFWKTRIETTDADKTFRVGLIYGPSGCGKSSLLKAGLLPRLAKQVVPVYVEATPEETESRLLKFLRKACPDLSTQMGLVDSLMAIRQGRVLRSGQKMLLVLDQFEQWLHARRGEENTELVAALRQCDGEHVQAVVMVRDDFWMAATRFMRDLEIDLLPDRNVAAVDLFDPQHAQKVLGAFGNAFGKLPERERDRTKDQHAFLDQAITELAQDGKVISVRLALFAEMMKGKTWTPVTLRQVGGTEGVGVTFLEETFSSPQANPKHRLHQKAAQAVLKALLPETGTDIKGQMRSEGELQKAAAYTDRPREFADLTHILDNELRLITPTDPEGSGDERPSTSPGGRYYQLTHDYLVHSLRDWLTRKQRETRKGRAELRLAERSSLWNAKPENRHLPSPLEWANIRLLTRKREWTEPQHKMMKRAGRVHGLRGLGTAALVAVLITLGLYVREGVAESNRATEAAGLVKQVLKADTAQVPGIVDSMKDYRRWVDPALKEALGKAEKGSPDELHARLALLPVDAAQVEPLFNWMLAVGPEVATVIRQSLEPHRESLTPKLWTVLDVAKSGDVSLLPAASALADYDASSQRWESVGGKVAQTLVTVNPFFFGPWLDALRPVRTKLTAPLASIFREKSRPESEHALASSILTDYASDDPDLVANLLMDADPKAYAAFFPLTQRQEAKALPVFQAEIARKATIPDGDKDAEIVKDHLAERQARAAVALVHLGKTEDVLPLLRHSADPRLRSFIVNWLNPLGVDPHVIAAALEHIDPSIKPPHAEPPKEMDAILFHPETSQRRALILALGTYGMDGLSPSEREPLTGKLLGLYRNDPDSGIHGAAEWTLRQWKQQEKIKELDAQLMKVKDWGDRRWFMNSQGQTFAVIEGPVEFLMGSPSTEPNRNETMETPRRLVIPRRFAIATKEVTIEQWQRFERTNTQLGLPPSTVKQYSPDPDGPMIGFTWYIAANYCNWLSEQEGLPKEQWCYLPNEAGAYDEGMTIPADVLQRTGYRLPIEAEWEYACRAGAITSRYYGLSIDLLDAYARYESNSKGHAWSCGSLLPNELGLFDMLGNMYEWCQDSLNASIPEKKGIYNDIINISESIVEKNPRILRGGTFDYRPALVRSAGRGGYAPADRGGGVGFRPSRTYH